VKPASGLWLDESELSEGHALELERVLSGVAEDVTAPRGTAAIAEPSDVAALIDRWGEAGADAALEVLGDRLTEWIHTTDALRNRPHVLREFASLAQTAYMDAAGRSAGRRPQLEPKILSVALLRRKFGLTGPRDGQRYAALSVRQSAVEQSVDAMVGDHGEELAELVVDALIPIVLGPALVPPWRKSVMLPLGLLVPALIELAHSALERDTHLALAAADWVARQIREPPSATRPPPPPALKHRAENLARRCAEQMADVDRRLGLDWAAWDAAERAAYRAMYREHRVDEARRLARTCLERGERLLAQGGGEEQRLHLLDRLFTASRLTGDVRIVATWAERARAQVSSRAATLERARRWVEAADSCSHLGYRYFCTAEYTGVARMYRLAVYFFDKAEVLRARDPEHGAAEVTPPDADGPVEAGYRRFEGEGFAYGASGRLAEPPASADLFDLAAAAHDRAAVMTFQSTSLHNLYISGAHFFHAQSALARCAQAVDLPEVRELWAEAAQSFRACITGTQSAFAVYEAVLVRLTEREAEPCPPHLVRELERTLHPDGEAIAAAARAAVTAVDRLDLLGLRAAIADLGRLFLYLNPRG
jgi:hypothetical protein